MDTPLARLRPLVPSHIEGFAQSLLRGLARSPKQISCKYFYDERGSRLFDAICRSREYYPTRTEIALLEHHGRKIGAAMGGDIEIVEFGAGNLRKIRKLLDGLSRPRAYTPIDISADYLTAMLPKLASDYPQLILRPLVADFTLPLEIPALPGERPQFVRRAGFFPGSTIGNFRPEAARALLRRIANMLKGGGLLIGVDLVKDPALLHAAYNDSEHLTAAFNKNLLVRANRELGANFDPDAFAHYAPYNPVARRIEMYLVSLKEQAVTLCGERFEFRAGESVHTEDSHKYTIDGFHELAIRAGFVPRLVFSDDEQLFSLHWLENRSSL